MTHYLRISIIVVFISGFIPGAFAQEFVAIPETGVRLGQGWDSARENALSNVCIEFLPRTSGAQTTELEMREVSDRSELMESLDVSATASVKAMGVSASAKAAFAKSSKVSAYALSFVVQARVDNGYDFVAPKPVSAAGFYPGRAPESWWARMFGAGRWDRIPAPVTSPPDYDPQAIGAQVKLTPWALSLAQKDDGSFERSCGDAFVHAIYGGAEMFGMVSIETSSIEKREDVSATVKASGSFFEAGASFEQEVKKADDKSTIEVRFFQSGGAGGLIASSREQFVKKLETLAGEAQRDPKLTRLAVMPYHVLANWPAPAGEWPPQNEFSERVAQYWTYTSLYEDMQQALENKDKFTFDRGVSTEELAQLQDEVHDIRRRLELMARDNAQLPHPLIRLSIAPKRIAAARNRLSAATGVDPQMLAGAEGVRWLADRDDADAVLLRLAIALDTPLKDPRWFLTRMPYPAKSEDTKDWSEEKLRDELATLYFEGPSKRRCRTGATARGCMSNKQIALWKSRIVLGSGLSRGPEVGDPHYGNTAFDDASEPRMRPAQLHRIDVHIARLGGLAAFQFSFVGEDGKPFSPGLHGITGPNVPHASLELEEGEHIATLEIAYKAEPIPAFQAFRLTTDRKRVFDAFAKAGIPSAKPTDRFEAPEGAELAALFGHMIVDKIKDKRVEFLISLGPVYRTLD
jgi:hypothetical protein